MKKPIHNNQSLITGRGAQINPPNQYDKHHLSHPGLIWNDDHEIDQIRNTLHIPNHPKSILNKIESPDVPFPWGMNPYQGCEHGCVYCYARNTHTYWGYSAGLDFEQKILIKHNAPELFEAKLKSKKWKATTIMLAGNTDCYQPAEKKYELTRKILQIALRYQHPISIITKNSLILRDLDILKNLASNQLVHVAITVTTLNEEVRRKLEPRTATGHKRIEVIHKLSEAGIPVNVMMGPIFPSLTDHEIPEIARQASDAGALSLSYTIVRLNGNVEIIFKDWLNKAFPNKSERIIHQIENIHGGKVNDSRFKTRMRVEGQIADIIKQQIQLVRKKYFADKKLPDLNFTLYEQKKDPQLKLF